MAMLNNQRVKSMICWVLKFEPYGIASVPGSFTSAIPEDWIANRGHVNAQLALVMIAGYCKGYYSQFTLYHLNPLSYGPNCFKHYEYNI